MNRTSRILASAIVAASLLAGGLPQVASAAEESTSYVEGTDAAAKLFDPLKVVDIDVELSDENIARLNSDPLTYVEASLTLKLPTETIGPMVVGLRLRGGRGSFRPLSEKASLKFKIHEFVPGQRLLGLKKLNLHNMIQDPTATNEVMAYRLFRAVGVPAPRVGYTNVRVNGIQYGVYANVEAVDRIFLKRWFESTQHLYEEATRSDIVLGREGVFEIDEGDELDRTDLTALATINSTLSGDEWYRTVSNHVDLAGMTQMWAVERFLGHWDGYSRDFINNYFLHSDDSGRFMMLPWGVDRTWRHDFGYESANNFGVMVQRCSTSEVCWALFARGAKRVDEAYAAGDYLGMHNAITGVIDPLYLSASDRREATPEQVASYRESKVKFLQRRAWRTDEEVFVAPYLPRNTDLTLNINALVGELAWNYSSLDGFDVWHEVQMSTNQGATWSEAMRVDEPRLAVKFQHGDQLRFRVRTVNLVGASAWSAPVSVMIPRLPSNPGLTARHNQKQTTLSWRKASALGVVVQGYRVQVSQDGKKWSLARAVSGTSTSFKTPKGSTRFYRIQVVTDFGTTPWSRAWKFKKTA